MAKPQYSTTELIASIKRRCAIPTSQMTYTETDFVALANDELQGIVVPLIMRTREEYFVTHTDVVIPSTGIIDIPSDAVGMKLRSVCEVVQASPLILRNIPRLDLDVVAGTMNSVVSNGGFYIEGDQLHIHPTGSSLIGDTVRVFYFKRALILTTPALSARVESIDVGSNTLTMNRIPSGWTTSTVLNSVSGTAGFNLTKDGIVLVSTSAPSLVVDSVTGISVGDYITEQGYSAIPQIPVEAHAYLAQLTAVKALEGLGDTQGMKNASDKAELLQQGLLTIVSQRVDGSIKKVINPSGGLRLRWGK